MREAYALLYNIALDFAPWMVSMRYQFFRPIVKLRIPRSAAYPYISISR